MRLYQLLIIIWMILIMIVWFILKEEIIICELKKWIKKLKIK